MPGIFGLIARVNTAGTARRILYSQEGVFRVRIITPNNETREIIGNAIQIGFGINGYYMPMPDLISASIRNYGHGIEEINKYELSQAFLRDYFYLVEYHTVEVKTYHTITDVTVTTDVGVLPI